MSMIRSVILTVISLFTSIHLCANGVNKALNISTISEKTLHNTILSHRGSPIKKIVIDAGHGGHDSGCQGQSHLEKNLTLDMALALEKKLSQLHPDIEVHLTRSTDVFIPLFRRIEFANEINADLFISIHCNYIKHAATKGTETYVLGLHRAEDNLEVAKRENASILFEKNYIDNYEGYDPQSPEAHIMMSMYQNNYLENSILFASLVEEQFGQTPTVKSRGVKQAGFAVLRRAAMPAVLIETGFLSNTMEEQYLSSPEGLQTIVYSIANAITAYKDTLIHQEIKTTPPALTQPPLPIYRVQIAAIKNSTIDIDSPDIRQIGPLYTHKDGFLTKYMVGHFDSETQARKALSALKKLGYTDAFLVRAND